MDAKELDGVLAFLRTAERLKDTLRTSHTSSGRRESVAEHTWRLCLMATVLQDEFPDVDFGRLVRICLVHDLGEALGGDIPAVAQVAGELKATQERRDLEAVAAPLPDRLRHELLVLWDEYEAATTPEAKLAKALDKLETILQHTQGRNPPGFDYEFNLGYGRSHTTGHPVIEALRASLDEETRRRAAETGQPGVGGRNGTDTPPPAHTAFLDRALPVLQADGRLVGVAAAGSFAAGTVDEFSDLDLVIAVEPAAAEAVSGERHRIAAALGPLVAAFTGEHVGEPRVLICLYAGEAGGPPLHVDLKFVSLPDVAARVDDPVVLWERDGRLTAALREGEARYPTPDPQWIEDRFWVRVHYAALKIGRGELFEAVDFLAFLRGRVLGPLILMEAGVQPAGVRRIETAAPARASELRATVAGHDRAACVRSLYAAAELYRSLRRSLGSGRVVPNEAAERTAMAYLDAVAGSLPAESA